MTNSTALGMLIGGLLFISITLLPTLVLSFRPKIYLTGRPIGFLLLLCVVALTVVMGLMALRTFYIFQDGSSIMAAHLQSVSILMITIYVSGLLICAIFWFAFARHLLIFHHSTQSEQVERTLRDEGWLISRHKRLNWTILTCSKKEVIATVKSARILGSLYVRVSHSRLRTVIGHMIH